MIQNKKSEPAKLEDSIRPAEKPPGSSEVEGNNLVEVRKDIQLLKKAASKSRAENEKIAQLEGDIRSLKKAAEASEEKDKKIAGLEKEISTLKKATATSETPIIAIAAFAVFCGYVWIMSNLPLPAGGDSDTRFGVGVASLFGGMITLGLAVGFTQFAMKALVEIAVALLAFMNILVGALIWFNFEFLKPILLQIWPAAEGDALFAACAAGAIALFVADVSFLFVLLPIARASRSSVLE